MLKVFEKTGINEFLVSENGDIYVKNTQTGEVRPRKSTLNKKRGYYYIRTPSKNWAVHRLVGKYFVDNPHNEKVLDHKDGNKLNNKASNLEWVSYKENSHRAKKLGLLHQIEKGTYTKYTQEQYNEVERLVKSGMSYTKAGKAFGMPYSTVAHFMRGSRGVKSNAN